MIRISIFSIVSVNAAARPTTPAITIHTALAVRTGTPFDPSAAESVEATSLTKAYFAGNEKAKTVVRELANELKISEAVLSVILHQISEDPCSKFINAVWDSGAEAEADEQSTSGQFLLAVVGTISGEQQR